MDCEYDMLHSLQFNVQVTSSYVFLGRFLTFFARNVEENTLRVINYSGFQFLKFMVFKEQFLQFKPSHQAAAACILLLNLYTSPAS